MLTSATEGRSVRIRPGADRVVGQSVEELCWPEARVELTATRELCKAKDGPPRCLALAFTTNSAAARGNWQHSEELRSFLANTISCPVLQGAS